MNRGEGMSDVSSNKLFYTSVLGMIFLILIGVIGVLIPARQDMMHFYDWLILPLALMSGMSGIIAFLKVTRLRRFIIVLALILSIYFGFVAISRLILGNVSFLG